MSANYYLHQNECPHCGRTDAPLHIGKSSAGWHFMLRVYPDKGITTLEDWTTLFHGDGFILDEYGQALTTDEMLVCITRRNNDGQNPPTAEFLRYNEAIYGKNGLAALDHVRLIAKGRGTWPSPGTWDYCDWEFS